MRVWLLCCLLWPGLASAVSLEAYLAAPENYGPVLMFRHAVAPGGGDPGNFDVNDCATQRNLSDAGRAQAVQIGEQLSGAGYQPQRILTSPWCRCRETAQLIGYQPVVDELGLASFFNGHVDRGKTLARLEQVMDGLDRQPVLMVTHFVVISAITGRGIGSGEGVIYDPATNQSWPLELN